MSKTATQCERILNLLASRIGEWVPLPEILDLHIAQYNARIFTLRKEGHEIESKVETQGDGSRHSWFRLVPKEKQGDLWGRTQK